MGLLLNRLHIPPTHSAWNLGFFGVWNVLAVTLPTRELARLRKIMLDTASNSKSVNIIWSINRKMETTTRKRKSPTCRNCGEVGHRASSLECPKRSEYLQKRPPSKRRNAQQSRQRHSSAGSSYSARKGKASSSTSASKSSTSSSPSADLSKTNWIYIDVERGSITIQ